MFCKSVKVTLLVNCCYFTFCLVLCRVFSLLWFRRNQTSLLKNNTTNKNKKLFCDLWPARYCQEAGSGHDTCTSLYTLRFLGVFHIWRPKCVSVHVSIYDRCQKTCGFDRETTKPLAGKNYKGSTGTWVCNWRTFSSALLLLGNTLMQSDLMWYLQKILNTEITHRHSGV